MRRALTIRILARLCAALMVTAAILGAARPAPAQAPNPRDYSRVDQVPRKEIDEWLKSELKKSKGDLEKGRYHFWIGFSTGHFGTDPVHAIAMRRVAFSLLNNTFTAGDRVTPLAWELDLWDTGDTTDLTQEPQTRARFVDEAPYSPRAGSRGGHDTERAIFDSLEKIAAGKDPASSVLLLLTNTNQSQGPTGERVPLFGSNNPRLAALIRSAGFRGPVRKSFTAKSGSQTLNIDVTALFPMQLKSLPSASAEGPRYPTFAPGSWQPAADKPSAGEALPNVGATGGGGGGGAGGAADSGGGAGGSSGGAPGGADGKKPAISTQAGAAGDGAEKKGEFPWWILIVGLLVVAAVLWLLMGKRPRREATAAPVAQQPKGRPLPGKITAVLGAAPNDVRVELKELNTAGVWVVTLDGGRPALLPEPEKPEELKGTRLAVLKVDPKRQLTVAAEGDVTFQNITGVRAAAGNPRQVTLQPNDRLLCRVAAGALGTQPLRMELIYSDK